MHIFTWTDYFCENNISAKIGIITQVCLRNSWWDWLIYSFRDGFYDTSIWLGRRSTRVQSWIKYLSTSNSVCLFSVKVLLFKLIAFRLCKLTSGSQLTTQTMLTMHLPTNQNTMHLAELWNMGTAKNRGKNAWLCYHHAKFCISSAGNVIWIINIMHLLHHAI